MPGFWPFARLSVACDARGAVVRPSGRELGQWDGLRQHNRGNEASRQGANGKGSKGMAALSGFVGRRVRLRIHAQYLPLRLGVAWP